MFRVRYRGLRLLRQHRPIYFVSPNRNFRLSIIRVAFGAVPDQLFGIHVTLDPKVIKMSSDRAPKYRQEIQQVSRHPVLPFAVMFGCIHGFLACLLYYILGSFRFVHPSVRLIVYYSL